MEEEMNIPPNHSDVVDTDVDYEKAEGGLPVTAVPSSSSSIGSEQNALDPPLSDREKNRDWLLDFMDNNKYIVTMNCFVLFIVVASGAVWFFMVTGWHTLCEPKMDCEPRNQVFNIAIHILTGCFSWMASVVYPWRCTHLLHSAGYSSPFRSNKVGLDLNGQATDDVWYHVPKTKRLFVLVLLHLNTLFQYANQVFRAIYATDAASRKYPANILTSVFFGLSFIMAGLGGSLYWRFTSDVRKHDKERFGLGPLDTAKYLWQEYSPRQYHQNPKERESREVPVYN